MTRLDSLEKWVQWWCCPWHWAHPQWKGQFAASCGLSIRDCESLMGSRHVEFLQSAGVAPSQPPPEPSENLLLWLALRPAHRELALALAQRICFAPRDLPAPADDSDMLWCQRLAKALRPGLWLDPEVTDARPLLGAWLGEGCWSRLRLAWAPGEVAESFGLMPANKLQTLWHAVLWRLASLNPQQE